MAMTPGKGSLVVLKSHSWFKDTWRPFLGSLGLGLSRAKMVLLTSLCIYHSIV